MSRHTNVPPLGSLLTPGLIAGLIAGAAITLVLTFLQVPGLEAGVFATLSGITIAAFVYRERLLTFGLINEQEERQIETTKNERRIDAIYQESLACMAYLDAGTLALDRVSPGLLQLLRIDPDTDLRGKSLDDLLRVNPSGIEAIITQAQNKNELNKFHSLRVEDRFGNDLNVQVSVNYFNDVHMVEMAFWISPLRDKIELDEMDNARKDLDRFRRGMHRREGRILELKSEVNQLAQELGRSRPYGVDKDNEDSRFPMPVAPRRSQVNQGDET